MSRGGDLKLAILLGDLTLDTLVRAKALAQAVLSARPVSFDSAPRIFFGLPQVADDMWRANARWLCDGLPDGVVVRRLSWERVLAANARRMFAPRDLPIFLHGLERVTIPRDGGTNFLDCSYWFVVASAGIGGVYPVRPTMVFCPELAQRRNPFAYAANINDPFWSDQVAAFRMWRQSVAVVASDPVTALDLVDYAGVAPYRAVELRGCLDVSVTPRSGAPMRERDEFLINLEQGGLQALSVLLAAIEQYLAEGGALRPVIASSLPIEAFGPGSNLPEVVFLPSAGRKLLEDLPAVHIRDHNHWLRVLASFGLVWFAQGFGGDGRAIREALRSGLQVLSPATPLTLHAHKQAGGKLLSYDASATDALVEVLHALEQGGDQLFDCRPVRVADDSAVAREIGLLLDRLPEPADV